MSIYGNHEHRFEDELIKAQFDNAMLKAEVERLDDLCKKLSRQHSDLSCENIMLRKAGDAMQKSMLECGPNEMAEAFHHDDWWASYNAWTAAKEGKMTK